MAAVEIALDCSGMPVLSPVESHSKRKAAGTATKEPKRQRRETGPLAQKVDTLAAEFAQIKALLLNLQPGAVTAALGNTGWGKQGAGRRLSHNPDGQGETSSVGTSEARARGQK